MIPSALTPLPQQPGLRPGQQMGQQEFQAPMPLQWIDQFSEEMLLTVQALQQLHAAFNTKFPPRGTG